MNILPRKRFGQHFLRDPQVLSRIQQAISPLPNQHIVEIGPGEGVLTQLLFAHVKQLDIIEIDRDLIAVLQQKYADHSNLKIHNSDVLRFNFASLSSTPQSLRIVGNLPYNISSPLIFKLFSHLDLIEDMHFMLQKEFVLRMTAKVGDSNYNRLSVMTQYFCDNILLFEIKPSAFSPPPKVDSAFVRMLPKKPELSATDLSLFALVVKQAFMHRRKTLSNCLKKLIDSATLEKVGIDPKLRPQQLSVNDFVSISNYLASSPNPPEE